MKKAYTKPEIIFDDFSLATTIAAGCQNQTHTPSWNMCGVDIPGVGHAFSEAMLSCMVKITEGNEGQYNFCYHVPTETNRLFNSL